VLPLWPLRCEQSLGLAGTLAVHVKIIRDRAGGGEQDVAGKFSAPDIGWGRADDFGSPAIRIARKLLDWLQRFPGRRAAWELKPLRPVADLGKYRQQAVVTPEKLGPTPENRC